MPKHRETRDLPYAPAQLYDLVADIDRYPDFLPWCLAARVKSRTAQSMQAELMIGFKLFRERYTSTIMLSSKTAIDVTQSSGPFRHLVNQWRFHAIETGTRLDFFVDFEFRSAMLQRAIQPLFNEATRRMVAAFETEAARRYDESFPQYFQNYT